MTTKKNYRNHARGLPRGEPAFPFCASSTRQDNKPLTHRHPAEGKKA